MIISTFLCNGLDDLALTWCNQMEVVEYINDEYSPMSGKSGE